ncbi:MAG TPA: hypothetical protein VGO47_10955 [Chlamydiales bacterium]|nr:hypothetical protein [Chlamydiales bacterium]
MPTFTEEEGMEEEEGEEEGGSLEELQHGDRILVTTLHPEPLRVKAMTTVSQRLAEAAAKSQKTEVKGFKEIVPEYLHDFEEVFSKTSFDSLPGHKKWNHAIELIPQAVPRSCKVYPLSPYEQ